MVTENSDIIKSVNFSYIVDYNILIFHVQNLGIINKTLYKHECTTPVHSILYTMIFFIYVL